MINRSTLTDIIHGTIQRYAEHQGAVVGSQRQTIQHLRQLPAVGLIDLSNVIAEAVGVAIERKLGSAHVIPGDGPAITIDEGAIGRTDGPEEILPELRGQARENYRADLRSVIDLVMFQQELVRERAVREAMNETGESREAVEEAFDAGQAMVRETTLEMSDAGAGRMDLRTGVTRLLAELADSPGGSRPDLEDVMYLLTDMLELTKDQSAPEFATEEDLRQERAIITVAAIVAKYGEEVEGSPGVRRAVVSEDQLLDTDGGDLAVFEEPMSGALMLRYTPGRNIPVVTPLSEKDDGDE